MGDLVDLLLDLAPGGVGRGCCRRPRSHTKTTTPRFSATAASVKSLPSTATLTGAGRVVPAELLDEERR